MLPANAINIKPILSASLSCFLPNGNIMPISEPLPIALWKSAIGMGSEIGIMLPFGRKQESEADRMGLIFMALAGYDPTEAIAFWQRMAANSGGQSVPQFLSTHPSDETRINDIRTKYLPEALTFYKKQ